MRQLIAKFRSDTRGATSIEYAVIAGSLSIVIIVGVSLVGTNLNAEFAKLLTRMS